MTDQEKARLWNRYLAAQPEVQRSRLLDVMWQRALDLNMARFLAWEKAVAEQSRDHLNRSPRLLSWIPREPG